MEHKFKKEKTSMIKTKLILSEQPTNKHPLYNLMFVTITQNWKNVVA